MLSKIYQDLCNQGLESDKGTAHSYIDFYEGLFYPYRHKHITLLEIGIQYGYSCALWSKYFDKAKIYGMDIERNQLYTEGYEFIHASATNYKARDYFFEKTHFDIIIDDGSHQVNDQSESFLIYWHKLKSGGLYIIEDIYDVEGNIDRLSKTFHRYGAKHQIFDFRDKKNRIDDVLIVLKK